MSKLLQKIFALAGRILCRWRRFRVIRAYANYIAVFQSRLENVNFNPRTNGEQWILRQLASQPPRIAIDVGANVGDWSRLLARLYPDCAIHAFEINPAVYADLENNLADLPQCVTHNMGLSDEAAEVTIHVSDTETDTATAYPLSGTRFHDEYYTTRFQGRVMRGADFLLEHNIENIDYLKIDVEGMDYQVLAGFGDLLPRVRVLQFEYGIFNIASHALLYDFALLLHGQGFRLGKLFPNFVEFFEYDYDRENFLGSNYIAVRAGETQLIRLLSRGRRVTPRR